jgi:ferredoxin-NADP reductase
VYPQGDDRPLALIAGGIGITPLIAMLRHAVACDPSRPVTLLYSARRECDVSFHNELRVLAERHPLVRVFITLTQPDRPTSLRTGRIDAAMIGERVPEAGHTIFCICGPGPMIADARAVLENLGVPASQVRFEQFDTAVAASQINTAPEHAAEAGAGGGVQVTFEASGRSVSAPVSRTLLETAEAEGVDIPSLCRSGVCQSCRTRLKDGTADCRSEMLDADDRAAGFILPCVSWPTGDCVLEA